MCGRFRLSRRAQVLQDHFGITTEVVWSPRYNIAPGQDVATVRQDAHQPARGFSLMRWGLVPYWAKDENSGYKMINARAESALERPAFREPLERRRCLILADGFYEWQKQEGARRPYCITMSDDAPFAFAGLWDRWRTPTGNTLNTCTILTTRPNRLCAEVHDRMPAILLPEHYEVWLDPGMRHAATAQELLRPYESSLMKKYPVSTRVNSVANEDAACAEPAASAATTSLFS